MSQNNNPATKKSFGTFVKAGEASKNDGTFRKNVGSTSKPEQARKPIGSWPHLANKADTKPGASRAEKANFLSGFAIGMIAGAKLPELQALKGLQGLKGETLDKLPDFKNMTDLQLDSWIDKYSALVDKL
jgi:hypothetical protein